MNGCQFANEDCAGGLEWHHVIKQQRLRREFKYGAWKAQSGAFKGQQMWWPLDRYFVAPTIVGEIQTKSLSDILGDTRNRIFLCSHHHELVTNGRLKLECEVCHGSGLINTENGRPATNAEAHRSDVDQCATCDGYGDGLPPSVWEFAKDFGLEGMLESDLRKAA